MFFNVTNSQYIFRNTFCNPENIFIEGQFVEGGITLTKQDQVNCVGMNWDNRTLRLLDLCTCIPPYFTWN